MQRSAVRTLLVCALLALLSPPETGLAQFPPDTFTNLKVLPEDVEVRELVNRMASFTRALGVRCSTCHVGEEGQPLATYDFASDDKLMKRKARVMLRMVERINSEHLTDLEERVEPRVRVECATCHRGVREPRMLQDILITAYDEGGLESAIATYDSLREGYYGRYAYDFGIAPLSDVAGTLRARGRLADAVQLYEKNAELFPESTFAQRQHAGAAVLHAFQSEGAEAGKARYLELKARYGPPAFPEPLLNQIGYALLGADHVEEAIAVFELNVEAYPDSFNVYDSLGEAYMAAGQTEKAIESYERSLELNPDNQNAVEKLEELRGRSG